MEISEAQMALQSCPKLGQEEYLYPLYDQSLDRAALAGRSVPRLEVITLANCFPDDSIPKSWGNISLSSKGGPGWSSPDPLRAISGKKGEIEAAQRQVHRHQSGCRLQSDAK